MKWLITKRQLKADIRNDVAQCGLSTLSSDENYFLRRSKNCSENLLHINPGTLPKYHCTLGD